MWRLFSSKEPQLLTRRVLRLKFEYCVVLRVRAPSWKDAVLSRFISEDRRMAEGKEKAEAVLQALRDAGLVLRVKKHLTKDGAKLLLVFVTADLRRLEQQSQRLFIERWLQEEGIGDTMGEHGSGSSIAARRAATKPAMRIVRVGGLHYFASDPKQQQQQQQPPAAEAEPPSTFKVSAAGRIELLDHILRSPAAQGGAGLEALQKESKRGGVIQAVFPLHDAHWNAELLRRARRVNPFIPSSRDAFLREVRGQFGEKVAFYFAFNCFYTSWLLVPAILGALLWTISFFAESQQQQLAPLYAAFIAIWASAMMKAWQRRANKLALDWGVANRRQVEVIRKGFEGWARTSAITGETEPHYPEWRRSVKYVLTGVVMLMQILMMVLIVCALYVGYFLVNSKYTGFPKYALNLGLSTAWGLSLELLNWIVWFKVAVRLTDFENHKTVQQHEDKLIIKIFVFYFIDCFLWFFILAFFQVARNSVHTCAIRIHTCSIFSSPPFLPDPVRRVGQRPVGRPQPRAHPLRAPRLDGAARPDDRRRPLDHPVVDGPLRRRVRAVPGASVAAATRGEGRRRRRRWWWQRQRQQQRRRRRRRGGQQRGGARDVSGEGLSGAIPDARLSAGASERDVVVT